MTGTIKRIKTISEYHQVMGHAKPLHPLVSVIHLENVEKFPFNEPVKLVYDFYCIVLKKNTGIKFSYGQQQYDFNEGTLFFMSPNQVFGFQYDETQIEKPYGWALLFHPDFTWNTSLATDIKIFEYFDYSANEALHLSGKEEMIIGSILSIIEEEYQANTDKFSQDIIITQIESLLTYADRFYQRQFITRKKAAHRTLTQFEKLLNDYFQDEKALDGGLPTVQLISDKLHLSPNYLSRLLTTLTGKSTQHYIQDKVIEIAKGKLSTTDLSIGEIAYSLGFEHPQSFSKLFKAKTKFSPLNFRDSFNNIKGV